MKEDLIERLTSMLFNDEEFSNTVLTLCRELTKEKERMYKYRVEEIKGIRPIHVGLSPYLTLDASGNIIEVFKKNHPDQAK